MQVSRRAVRGLLALVLGVLASAALLVPALPAAAQQQGWSAGPGASGDNTYQGYIDVPANGASVSGSNPITIGGWVVDTTAQGWAGIDGIQVVNGQLGSGGTVLAGSGIVGENRSDVAAALGNAGFAASGFSATVPAGALGPGQYTLSVYAHTPNKGSWYKTVNLTVTSGGGQATPTPSASNGGGPVLTVIAPMPEEAISTQRSDYTIRGTAYDPNMPSGGISSVQVYINGPRDGNGQSLGNATISGTDWSLTFTPTRYPSTHANLYVYARSSVTGKETMVLRGFSITDASGT